MCENPFPVHIASLEMSESESHVTIAFGQNKTCQMTTSNEMTPKLSLQGLGARFSLSDGVFIFFFVCPREA